jgi:hypothetical protein
MPRVSVVYELTESCRALGRALEPLTALGRTFFFAEEPEAALLKEPRVACDYFVDDSAARPLAPS